MSRAEVVAEDLRALTGGPFDQSTRDLLCEAADLLDSAAAASLERVRSILDPPVEDVLDAFGRLDDIAAELLTNLQVNAMSSPEGDKDQERGSR